MPRLLVPVVYTLLLLFSLQGHAQKQGQAYIDSVTRELPKAKDDTARAKLYHSLSATYYRSGEYPSSLEYNLKALKISEPLENKEIMSASLELLGKNYLALAENKYHKKLPDSLSSLSVATRLQEAHYYLSKAIEIQKEINNIDLLQESYEHLSRVQLLQGDTAGSRESFRKYNAYLAGVYNKEKGNEIVKKDMKEVFTKKQEKLKQESEQKQLTLQKEIELNSLTYEYEKKQAEAKNEQEREQLKYEEQLRQEQIKNDFEKKQALLEAEKEKSDAVNAIMINDARRERNYYLAGLGMLLLMMVGMFNRFIVLRRNRRILEGKNKQIEAEKESADRLRERAENSERFKQQFLANMSHEIRTPMNAVNGMTDLLLSKAPREDQVSYLVAISKSADILLHIINDILDLSKIEAGKMELEAIDFSISETLQQVKDTLSHRADEKGLQLTTSIADDVADVVIGDPYRLNQVLINLAGNAIKFTERGGVSVGVKCSKRKGNHLFLQFSVTDSGIGIPEDKVKTLFQSFTQVHSSDSRKYGGTGLGLSISKQLVELHGGTIAVESTPGSGTTFSFTICYPEGSPEKLQQRLHNERTIDGSVLNGLKILVADDNEYNRLVVSETLQLKADVTIAMALNGEEAVKMHEQQRYDVILMDVQMPVMSGIEATFHIREKFDSPGNKVPIVALTASIMRSDIDKFMECGMNSFIPKPFKAWQLISTVADVTGRKISGTALPQKTGDNTKDYAGYAPGSSMITDFAYLKNFCEGDEARIKKYVGIYLHAAPAFIEKMTAAAKAKDLPEIRSRIHAFKPNWMAMGMKRTADLGTKIEEQCHEQSYKVYDSITALLEQMNQSIKELEGSIS